MTAKKSAKPVFALADEHAKLGKIANNLENPNADPVTGFTLPLEFAVDRKQLNALMGEDFDRAVYGVDGEPVLPRAGDETDHPDLLAPVDGFRRCAALQLKDAYEDVEAHLAFTGDRHLTYSGCKVSDITLSFEVGGVTRIGLHLYVHPGIGHENLLLQEHQKREVGVELSGGKLATKSDKRQQNLPLAGGGANDAEGAEAAATMAADATPADEVARWRGSQASQKPPA
ncbi:MAG: hypothetical protein ACRETS_02795 [Steroidobacteraceae bacterium]